MPMAYPEEFRSDVVALDQIAWTQIAKDLARMRRRAA